MVCEAFLVIFDLLSGCFKLVYVLIVPRIFSYGFWRLRLDSLYTFSVGVNAFCGLEAPFCEDHF